MAASQRSKKSGFIFTDILAGCFILGLAAAMLLVGGSSWLKYYHQKQLKQAAAVLSADIRLLQRQSLFDDGILNRQIKFMTDKKGYAFYVDRKVKKRIYFSDFGCGDVRLDNKLAYVQYTNNGSPSMTGNIILKHQKLPGSFCTISIQPVTGRVVISEEK